MQRSASLAAAIAVSCFLLVISSAAPPAMAQSGPGGVVVQVVTVSTQDAASVLRRVRAVMARESKVPLRWPAYLGTEIGAGHPLFVNLLNESATDYEMELGWSSDCIGGAYCHYGTVRGNAGPAAASTGTAVKLQDGISGYFQESKCNASSSRCSDASMGWSEGDYHYAVSLKDGKEEELIRMANSAIASGAADRHR